MLPKNRRIPRKMFPFFLNGAKTFKNSLFFVKFVHKDIKENRFCFSVSKKVAKKAVTRNKMRRAGYRLLKNYISELNPKILAIFSFRSVPKDDEEIIKNLESAITKLN